MAHDFLYNDFDDPLQGEVKEAAKEEISQVEENGARIVAVMQSRAEVYAKKSDEAQENGALNTARELLRTAKELAYLARTIGAGKLEELEERGD